MTTLSMILDNNFTHLASDAQIKHTMNALEINNIHAILVENGAEAKMKLMEIFPAEAEVFTATSVTLKTIGVDEEINQSGRYNSVRAKLAEMDQNTQNRDMQKMGATPEYIIGSVHAVTETGRVIIGSNTGSQLAGYVSGAAHVIWIVGTQKIVATLEDALERLEKYSLPQEDARLFKEFGVKSNLSKVLIVNRESKPGRTTMILVKENLGF